MDAVVHAELTPMVKLFDFTDFTLKRFYVGPGLAAVAIDGSVCSAEILTDEEMSAMCVPTVCGMTFLCGHCGKDHKIIFTWDGRALVLIVNEVLADADGALLSVSMPMFPPHPD